MADTKRSTTAATQVARLTREIADLDREIDRLYEQQAGDPGIEAWALQDHEDYQALCAALAELERQRDAWQADLSPATPEAA